MGWSLSPVMENIHIEYPEEIFIGKSQIKSAMWLLYLDDNVILWPQRKDIQTMLDHVNSTRPSIQFTI